VHRSPHALEQAIGPQNQIPDSVARFCTRTLVRDSILAQAARQVTNQSRISLLQPLVVEVDSRASTNEPSTKKRNARLNSSIGSPTYATSPNRRSCGPLPDRAYYVLALGMEREQWVKTKKPPGNRVAPSLGRIVPTEAKPSELSGEILSLAKTGVKD
jgi:hypothetical protein